MSKEKTNGPFYENNFWVGWSSILSLFGGQKRFNLYKSDQTVDIKAIKSDWERVGKDIKISMLEYKF